MSNVPGQVGRTVSGAHDLDDIDRGDRLFTSPDPTPRAFTHTPWRKQEVSLVPEVSVVIEL